MPLHMHPYYQKRFGYQPEDLPVAKAAYERVISLPIYAGLQDESVEYVIDNVRRIVTENRR